MAFTETVESATVLTEMFSEFDDRMKFEFTDMFACLEAVTSGPGILSSSTTIDVPPVEFGFSSSA